MGYAALVVLQDNIKHRLHIGDNASAMSYQFSFAASLLYFGNLVFRLMHNVIFSPFRPRTRVFIAYSCMSAAQFTLVGAYYLANTTSIVWTYVAYILGGVAVGTFESNLISCLTPLGHGTKVWAQLGISVGFNGVSIGAFLLFAAFPLNLHVQAAVYAGIGLANIAAIVFYICAIPDVTYAGTVSSILPFWNDLKQWREWIPATAPFAVSLLVDMACLGFFSAVQLYIYDVPHIPLWWRSQHTISINWFRAVYTINSLCGDALGRKLAYMRKRHIHPAWFLCFSVVGGAMVLSKIALIAPTGYFFVMFANGSVYATTTKFLDNRVAHRYNLSALSFWLFIGDIGSFGGSNLVNVVRVAIGPVPTT